MGTSLSVAVIADDLTGAADTGVQFCPALGPVAVLHTMPQGCDGLPTGLAISTHSRHLSPDSAARAVRTAVKQVLPWSIGLIYKKIDSCLRGNLGGEIEALLAATGSPAVFVAPAYPEQGRTTEDGIHLLNGRPVAETEIGQDPRDPVTTSNLADRISLHCRLAIATIGLNLLEGADEPLIDTIHRHLDNHRRLIIFDALHRRHLDRIAALVVRNFPTVVPVGSAGLAGSLAMLMTPGQPPTPTTLKPIASWLFICGSASPTLTAQVARLVQSTGWPHLCIEAAELATGRTKKIFHQAQTLFEDAERKGLIITVEPRAGYPPAVDPEHVAHGLAAVGAKLAGTRHPNGLFLCGGDTAEAVLRHVRATGLLLHDQPVPGLVRGEFVGGTCPGLPVVTKAGGFGDEETLIRLVNRCAP
ncbi:MAG: four-carbon acid sugar kinase family protein [Desulfofustis sp.]|jgi:uncharacterized protein YgbK (DUF1537 family)|nr:four-carbon acid sugar kinase family protein [Desulfofustis sp.]